MDNSKEIGSGCGINKMILKRNHIELKLIDESTIELLRNWRNASTVNQFMEYQAQISKEQQLTWFNNLSKEKNYYFIIHSENKPIGMIHLSNLDGKYAESGMFITESNFKGTGVAFNASILLLDFAFEKLGLEIISAKVKNNNKIAQQYNQLLGFKFESKLNDSFSNWILSEEDYLVQREMIKKLLG